MEGDKAGVDKPDEGRGVSAGDLVDGVDEGLVHERAYPALRCDRVDGAALVGDPDGDQVGGFAGPPETQDPGLGAFADTVARERHGQ